MMSHAMMRGDLDADPPQQVGVLKVTLNCGPPAVICAHHRMSSTADTGSLSASLSKRKDVCFSIGGTPTAPGSGRTGHEM